MIQRPRSGLLLSILVALAACGAPIPPAVIIEVPRAAPIVDDAARCQDGVARLLASLREPMTITLHATRRIPAFDAAAQRIERLLEGYARRAPGKLTIHVLGADTEQERAAATEAGLDEVTFTLADGQEVRGILAMTFSYRGTSEQLVRLGLPSLRGIELRIATMLHQLEATADGPKIRIGVVTGTLGNPFDEANLVIPPTNRPAPTIKRVFEAALPYLQLEPVALDRGDLDPGLRALVLTQPAEDLTDAALARIDHFMMLGDKGLLVLAGSANLRAGDPRMIARLDTHRLEKLLGGYGIEPSRALLLDWARPAIVTVPLANKEVAQFPYPPILLADNDPRLGPGPQRFDTTFPGFFILDALPLAFPSPLTIHAERQPEARFRVVARSSPKATLIAGDTADLAVTAELHPAGEYATHDVAVAVEGRLRSAFPVAGAAPETSRLADRVVVIAASQFAANPFVRAGDLPPTAGQAGAFDPDLRLLAQPYAQSYLTDVIVALKNTFNWMTTDGDDIRACGALLSVDEPRAR
jgi:hypothetical protein